MSIETSMANYYAERAEEYERIYAKPERQHDLRRLRSFLERTFAGSDVMNFPTESELRAAVDRLALEVQVQFLRYYWILSYVPNVDA